MSAKRCRTTAAVTTSNQRQHDMTTALWQRALALLTVKELGRCALICRDWRRDTWRPLHDALCEELLGIPRAARDKIATYRVLHLQLQRGYAVDLWRFVSPPLTLLSPDSGILRTLAFMGIATRCDRAWFAELYDIHKIAYLANDRAARAVPIIRAGAERPRTSHAGPCLGDHDECEWCRVYELTYAPQRPPVSMFARESETIDWGFPAS